MGRIFGAFALSYALFEVPTGWLGDWIGPRKVLLRIVLWWSAFTAITGDVEFRLPCGSRDSCSARARPAVSRISPKPSPPGCRRLNMFALRESCGPLRVGAVRFTPVLVVWVLRFVNWHWAFVMFGGLGVIWAFFFARWYRDNPADHPSVNAAELALLKGSERLAAGHAKVPWGKLLRSRSVWLLWLQYFCSSFPWYFNITWLPTYLQQHWKLAPAEAARFAILPLFFGGLGALFCGSISASFARRVGLARSRRILATFGFFGAGSFLALAIQFHDPKWTMLSMGMASFCNDLAMPPSWAACMDIGGKYAGTVSGSMNMMGNLAGYASPVIGGYILQATGRDWNVFLYVLAAVYLAGTAIWPFIDPETAIE